MQFTWRFLTLGTSWNELMDEPKSLAEKTLASLLLLLGFLLLVPLAILFGIGFYLAALMQAVRLIFRPSSTPTEPTKPLQSPHFTESLPESALVRDVRKARDEIPHA